ncbi:unnamed protein product [Rotaria magnacalcarata]|uniref:GDP-D-glucose phosphorylase 1 n=1 Tax=Rotaria magnacalcarata TaxID=392030 RepID=A0A815N7J2_9BILA|nr:unnamed protein product [Rotaria magnacalcarata]CAF1428258.1 unnamed protein product [Rotaria magnacalcarata]CAF1981981.1 unnamed protein product [Rotaria magnacalcarata]CAF3908296.1 unnamed protein product [Rotaria magnacalcarata]
MWKHFKFDPNSVNFSCFTDEKFNEFDNLLRCEWEHAVSQGLFMFTIDYNAKQRILDDGGLNYIIGLNRDRQEKRRVPYLFEHVNIPFDNKKFHFNKIKDAEVLFSLDDEQQTDKHLIIINAAPIRPYHVLLVPYRKLEQPQVVTADCIVFGCEFVAASAHPYLVAGLNSLCAYASVNHLHLHGMYCPGRMFIQTLKCSVFHTKSNCYLLDSFQPQAFAFEVKHIDEFNKISQDVYRITNYLTLNNIAHNVAIVKGDSFSSANNVLRIFIWFRQSITNGKKFERCNFAFLELGGFMTMPDEEVYNTLTESEMCQHMNALALSVEEQKRIKDDVKNLLDN